MRCSRHRSSSALQAVKERQHIVRKIAFEKMEDWILTIEGDVGTDGIRPDGLECAGKNIAGQCFLE
jgi:hypothetical protein